MRAVGFAATLNDGVPPVEPPELPEDAGNTVRLADCVVSPNKAVMATGVDVETAVVVMLNISLVEPAETVMV